MTIESWYLNSSLMTQVMLAPWLLEQAQINANILIENPYMTFIMVLFNLSAIISKIFAVGMCLTLMVTFQRRHFLFNSESNSYHICRRLRGNHIWTSEILSIWMFELQIWGQYYEIQRRKFRRWMENFITFNLVSKLRKRRIYIKTFPSRRRTNGQTHEHTRCTISQLAICNAFNFALCKNSFCLLSSGMSEMRTPRLTIPTADHSIDWLILWGLISLHLHEVDS